MWSKMLLLSLNIYILLSIVDGTQIVFLENVVKKIPTYETLAMNETVLVDKFTNETKPIHVCTCSKIANKTQNMNETKTMNETKPLNETIHLQPQNSTSNADTLTLGLLDATLNIDRSIQSLQPNSSSHDYNIIISPICIAAAMSLILLGSHGETKTEVGKLFGYDEIIISHLADNNNQNFKDLGRLLSYFQTNSGEKLGTEVNLAKAMFVQYGYNLTNYFKKAAEDYLKTELVKVDFKSDGQHTKNIINQWVSNQTRGKINDILPEIPPVDTKTIIASALYFTGEWENPFFINYTRIKPFCNEEITVDRKSPKQNKDCIYVPMMVGSSEAFFYKNEGLEFKAFGLPYKGNQFITYFVLPDANVSLSSLTAKMNGKTIRNITKTARITELTYFVPKMTLKSLMNLRPVLQTLGINKMFDPSKADLSNMTTDPDAYISDILHQVEIDVNEIGTVAAAATVVTITRGGQTTFNLNKPFIFFIHHVESDTVVFWSTVYKPMPYSMTAPNSNSYKKT